MENEETETSPAWPPAEWLTPGSTWLQFCTPPPPWGRERYLTTSLGQREASKVLSPRVYFSGLRKGVKTPTTGS